MKVGWERSFGVVDRGGMMGGAGLDWRANVLGWRFRFDPGDRGALLVVEPDGGGVDTLGET
ncbi:MAG TPA: hypothetical protein DEH07_10800, partial [Desulfotomaculum sp.]|nr:hypothetical protein [Desulfotomaculum sp.]